MEVISGYTNGNNNDNSYQQLSLVNEITQGMELARQLRANLGPEFSTDTKSALLQQILSSYDKALLLLGHHRVTVQQPHQLAVAAAPVVPSSPISFTSSLTVDMNVAVNGHHHHHPQPDTIVASKKRKATTSPVKTEQVRAKPGYGTEGGIPEDGFSWRKYGQKDILGARYPRSYYRCTYRGLQNCRATRKVQRSDDDPTLFNISYKGTHTCCITSRQPKTKPTIIPPPSDHQQPLPSQTIAQQQYDYSSISGFPMGILNLPIMEFDMGSNGMTNFPLLPTAPVAEALNFPPQFNNSSCDDHLYTSYIHSPSYISPSSTASGSNYFSTSTSCNPETFGVTTQQYQQQTLDSDISEIISATTSVTNSPRIEPDFSLHTWGFNPHDDFFY